MKGGGGGSHGVEGGGGRGVRLHFEGEAGGRGEGGGMKKGRRRRRKFVDGQLANSVWKPVIYLTYM